MKFVVIKTLVLFMNRHKKTNASCLIEKQTVNNEECVVEACECEANMITSK